MVVLMFVDNDFEVQNTIDEKKKVNRIKRISRQFCSSIKPSFLVYLTTFIDTECFQLKLKRF